MLSQSEEFTERLARFCASRSVLSKSARVEAPPFNPAYADATHARHALIAIVDDDQWAREGMNSFVASLGYSGQTFISAEDYLGSDLKQRAECLILDVHLRGMNGPDLQARLLADGYCTPIIFVSAHFEERVRDRVMDAGALGYFTKPCDERALINCLKRAVG
jgi:FixJ family two-component response regulator